ncbi:COG1470 family protein [Robiginitomaculum antarcticum]|uniref:COG1470 family protein n=1 Tax=Robiginitomaculum antarcticum TaxID=437507 RepID=UPI00035CF0DE|nr:hypothetical protein [Robiginitomaculum antarcticum]
MGIHSFAKLTSTSALICAALLGLSFGTAHVAGAFGLGVQPSTVEMTIKPGDRQRQVVTIGNVHKTKTISLTMSLADWSLDKDGKLVLDAPGDSPRSASEWVRFSPASVTLKPETSQDVVVEITVPMKVEEKGDHRFALLATTLLPELDKRGDNSGVWNRYQLASLFYLTLTPSSSEPSVKTVSFVGGDAPMLSMEIKNEGNAHARLQGIAHVKNESGETVSETPLSTVVLDRQSRTYNVKLTDSEKITPGEYSVEFDMNNVFAPQNKFRSTAVEISPIIFVAD